MNPTRSQLLIDENDRPLPAFYAQRREVLRAVLPEHTAALLFSNPMHHKVSNVYYPYDPQKDLLYLSGYQEPNSLLVIFKTPHPVGNRRYGAILFAQDCKAKEAAFESGCADANQVQERLGIEKVLPASAFASFSPQVELIYTLPLPLTHPTPSIAEPTLHTLVAQYRDKIKALGLGEENTQLRVYLDKMREIKTEEEIYLIKKAVYISVQGHKEAMKAMHEGMTECELQGVHEWVHKRHQARRMGYEPILASGENGSTLHYTRNTDRLGSHLVLMDVGAQYRGYTADITRTVPASGVFSKEQRAVYEAVRRAQEAAIAICTVGTKNAEITKKSRTHINQSLARLGIIGAPDAPHAYFPHGATHHIGLYVHDVSHTDTLQPGMVITVEPGIYIPSGSPCDRKWWGLSVRIEDNVLITEEGPVVLSSLAPKSPEAIEQLMRESSVLSTYTPHAPE